MYKEFDRVKITGRIASEPGAPMVTALRCTIATIQDDQIKVWPMDSDDPQLPATHDGKLWFVITETQIEGVDKMRFWYPDSYARKVREIECTLDPRGVIVSTEVHSCFQPLEIGVHIFVSEVDAYDALLERVLLYKQKISHDILRLTEERNAKGVSIEFLTMLIEECEQHSREVQDSIDIPARKERLSRFIAKTHDSLYMIKHRLKSDGKTICELRKQLEARQNPVIVDESI